MGIGGTTKGAIYMIEAIWNTLPPKVTWVLNRIHDARLRVFIPCALLLMILQNGIWVIPNIEILRKMSSDITRNMLVENVEAQYLYTSFLGLALGWISGLYRTTAAFAAMHFAAFIVGTVGLTWIINRHYGTSVVKLILVGLFCAPLSNILLNWLGISDVFTYIFGTLIVLTTSLPLLFVSSFLLGISHMEQGSVIALIVITKISMIDDADRPIKILRIGAVALGIVSAKIFFLAYFQNMHFNLTFTRASFATPEFAYLFLVGFFRNLPVTVYAFYSTAWILVTFSFAFALKSGDKRLFYFMLITNAIAAAISALVYDSTRVFTLIVWPAFVASLLRMHLKADVVKLKKATMFAFGVGIIFPKIIVWAGKMQSSAILYDILFIIEILTHKGLIYRLKDIHIDWPFAY
jgi:hypothetical protein